MFSNSMCHNRMTDLGMIFDSYPDAVANVRGSSEYKNINGRMIFYQTEKGVIIATQINGLPHDNGKCKEGIFALHIHEGTACSGNMEDPFADALMHYNPKNCQHPYHTGDLPPLFGNKGYVLSVFMTDRFTVSKIIGKTVIIHSGVDDFTSQPSGNAGEKIACGVIKMCKLL